LKALKRLPSLDSQTVEVFQSDIGAFFGYDKEDHHLAFILKAGRYYAVCPCMIRGWLRTLHHIPWEWLDGKLADDLRGEGFE